MRGGWVGSDVWDKVPPNFFVVVGTFHYEKCLPEYIDMKMEIKSKGIFLFTLLSLAPGVFNTNVFTGNGY